VVREFILDAQRGGRGQCDERDRTTGRRAGASKITVTRDIKELAAAPTSAHRADCARSTIAKTLRDEKMRAGLSGMPSPALGKIRTRRWHSGCRDSDANLFQRSNNPPHTSTEPKWDSAPPIILSPEIGVRQVDSIYTPI